MKEKSHFAEKKDEKAVRLDAWLYAVRFFKSRSLAKERCSQGHVKINGSKVKPSQKIEKGLVVVLKKDSIWRSFEILKTLKKRVSAKCAIKYFEEKTDKNVLEKLKLIQIMKAPFRKKSLGRPTKKDRREMDKFRSSL